MIKSCFKIILIIVLINAGCSAQKNSLTNNIETAGNKRSIADSLLQNLQANNDLVIAYAVENTAWIRSVNFNIIAKKNNEWKGYTYHKNLMKNNAGSATSIQTIAVDKAACDSVVNYIEKNKAWNIAGDSGNGFCADANKNCNISDVSGMRLWMITKNAFVDPYYYAPVFFEKCCPNNQRSLFLSIIKKIAAATGNLNTAK